METQLRFGPVSEAAWDHSIRTRISEACDRVQGGSTFDVVRLDPGDVQRLGRDYWLRLASEKGVSIFTATFYSKWDIGHDVPGPRSEPSEELLIEPAYQDLDSVRDGFKSWLSGKGANYYGWESFGTGIVHDGSAYSYDFETKQLALVE